MTNRKREKQEALRAEQNRRIRAIEATHLCFNHRLKDAPALRAIARASSQRQEEQQRTAGLLKAALTELYNEWRENIDSPGDHTNLIEQVEAALAIFTLSDNKAEVNRHRQLRPEYQTNPVDVGLGQFTKERFVELERAIVEAGFAEVCTALHSGPLGRFESSGVCFIDADTFSRKAEKFWLNRRTFTRLCRRFGVNIYDSVIRPIDCCDVCVGKPDNVCLSCKRCDHQCRCNEEPVSVFPYSAGTKVRVTEVVDDYGDRRNIGRFGIITAGDDLPARLSSCANPVYVVTFVDDDNHLDRFWIDVENNLAMNQSVHYHIELERI